jgi:hypothetical protein
MNSEQRPRVRRRVDRKAAPSHFNVISFILDSILPSFLKGSPQVSFKYEDFDGEYARPWGMEKYSTCGPD